MSARAAGRPAWAIWGLTVVAVGIAVVFGNDADESVWPLVATVVFVLAFGTVGALVASRRPGNPLGWIMCAAGLAYAVGGLSVSYMETDPARDAAGGALIVWVGSWVWAAGAAPAATFLLLLFPTGRLPSRRWRVVAWLAAGALALVLAGVAFAPGPISETPFANPVGLDGTDDVLDAAANVGIVALTASIAASIASLVVRFRRAARSERLQLKWLTFAAAMVGLGLAVSVAVAAAVRGDTTHVENTIVTGSLAVVPVAIGIAILRHRLFDIDVVINRTLVYGGLTAALAATYLGSVLLLQLVLSPDNSLAVAASTLAVAALFRPARARIQAVVDRRFYRRRYDAARTLEVFSARLREELDLDTVGGDLRAVARETVQPAHVSLWLRSPE